MSQESSGRGPSSQGCLENAMVEMRRDVPHVIRVHAVADVVIGISILSVCPERAVVVTIAGNTGGLGGVKRLQAIVRAGVQGMAPGVIHLGDHGLHSPL